MFGRWGFNFLLALTCQLSVSAQSAATTLEQIKIAADAGDPAAQVEMGVKDPANAEMWYRKAADQGFVPAQGKLGDLLLLRSRSTIGASPEAQAALADETVKWVTLAATQGDKQGEADMAQICLEGKLVKPDLIEAYKWGELAAENPSPEFIFFSGASTRNEAILKMNEDQIAEARRRVAAFKPHVPTESDLPTPFWVKNIKLNGISGGAGNRLAIINDMTFAKGDSLKIKVAGKLVAVHCLEIHDRSALVEIEGVQTPRELTLDAAAP
jgi:hypothetical protein